MLEKGKLRGAMITVGLSEIEAEVFISNILVGKGKAIIACIKSRRSERVSGDRAAIISLQSMLEARENLRPQAWSQYCVSFSSYGSRRGQLPSCPAGPAKAQSQQ